MNIVKSNIANALTSAAKDHVLGVAADIYDESLGKYQSELNAEAKTVGTDNTTVKANIDKIVEILSATATGTDASAKLTDIKTKLTALGAGYKTQYELAQTVKNFLESVDADDTKINRWKEIEAFLVGVTDTETLTGIIEGVKTELDTKITQLNTKVDAVKVKDVTDPLTIQGDGVIALKIAGFSGSNYEYSHNSAGPYPVTIGPTVKSEMGGALTTTGKIAIFDGSRDLDSNNLNLITEKGLISLGYFTEADLVANLKTGFQVSSPTLLNPSNNYDTTITFGYKNEQLGSTRIVLPVASYSMGGAAGIPTAAMIQHLALLRTYFGINENNSNSTTNYHMIPSVAPYTDTINGKSIYHNSADDVIDITIPTTEEINTQIDTKIAAIVADAPEDFDTLKEIADWIAKHPESVAELNTLIQTNKTAIEAIKVKNVDDETLGVDNKGVIKVKINAIKYANLNNDVTKYISEHLVMNIVNNEVTLYTLNGASMLITDIWKKLKDTRIDFKINIDGITVIPDAYNITDKYIIATIIDFENNSKTLYKINITDTIQSATIETKTINILTE